MAVNLMDVEMPDGTIIEDVPEGTSKEDILAKYQKYTQSQSTQDSTITDEFKKGWGSTGALLERAAKDYIPGFIAGALGDDQEAAKQFQDAKNRLKEQSVPTEAPKVGSLSAIKSPHDAALFVASQVGQGLSQLGLTAASGAAGAIVGGLTSGPVGAAVGGTAGALTPSIPLNFADVTDSFVQEGLNPDEHKALIAGTTGAISAIDSLTGARLGLKAAGQVPKEVAKGLAVRLAKAGVKSFNEEAFTEAVQQVVEDNSVNIAEGKPLSVDWDSTLTAAIGGGISGGVTGAIVETLPNGKKNESKEQFIPEEEVISESPTEKTPETTPEAPQSPLESVSPEIEPNIQPTEEKVSEEAPKEPISQDEQPTPPVEAYEKDAEAVASSKPVKPVETPPLIKMMEDTSVPTAKSIPLQNVTEDSKNSKFNLYSNDETPEGLNWRGYIKNALTHVGFDEDVIFYDPRNDGDDIWFGLDSVAPGIGRFRDKLKELRTSKGNVGGAVQFKDDNGQWKHLFYVNQDAIKNPYERAQGFIHDGLGHAIVNRFIMRDPIIREGMFDLVNEKLRSKGVDTTGISANDVNKLTGSWAFDEKGEPLFISNGDEKFIFTPLDFGNQLDTTLPEEQQYLQYRTAKDEVLTEQVARWFQTNEPAISVMDKFFKAIADAYRAFLTKARDQGLLPWKEVDYFMNSLVMKARGTSVAREYSASPEMGLQELKAYHGSPHRFTEFSTKSIGTGEGYQAFGWGLYFTNSKAIAKFYRDKLSYWSGEQVEDSKGNIVTWDDLKDFAKQNNIVPDVGRNWATFSKAFDNLATLGYKKAKELFSVEGGSLTINNKDVLQYIELLNKQGYKKTEYKKGAIYQVNIPEENEYLGWEDSYQITPELEHAFPNYKFSYAMDKPVYHKGQDIYQALVDSEGSLRAASEYLNSLGIKGIKYPAGTMSGIKESNATNYVVFDDAAIQINKVFDDDTLFAQLKAQKDNQEKESNPENIFNGYTESPKLSGILSNKYTNLSSKTLGILQGFASNLKNNTLAGAQNASQQYIALSDVLTDGGIDKTYFPEVYRGLIKNTKVTPDSFRNIMNTNNSIVNISEALRKYYNLSKDQMNSFSVADIQAEAYSLFNSQKENNPEIDSFVKSLPEPVLKVFNGLSDIKRSIKQELNANGITTPNDVLVGMSNQVLPSLESLTQNIKDVRNQAQKETLESRGLAEVLSDDAHGGESGYSPENVGLGWFGRNAITPHYWARKVPALARLVNAAEQRREAISSFQHILSKGFENFFNLPESQRDYLGNILDEQRILGKKAIVDTTKGTITFQRRNTKGGVETVKVNNPALAKVYDEVTKTLSIVPEAHKNQLTRAFSGLFGKANLGFSPTRETFDAYKKALRQHKVAKDNALTESQLKEIDQYFDTMDNISSMQMRDYIPHERHGNTGVTIKDDKGNLVWFGSYMKKPNGKNDSDSYQEMLESLNKWKASNPKFKDVKPSVFTMTQDNITRQLGMNSKSLTIELLNQLLENKVDTETYNNLNDSVLSKITPKAFLKHFNEAKFDGVPGYSTDWSRVLSSYSSKAAYFLGNMENEPKLMIMNSRIQNDSTGNINGNTKDFAQKYTESIVSPKETFSGLREIQYLYTMGGNISSALLQLSSMATYMPGVITIATNNAFTASASMVKGANLARKFFSPKLNQSLSKSLFAFDDEELHEKLVKNGDITRQESDIIKSLYNQGLLQALRSGDVLGVPSDISSKTSRGKRLQKLNEFSAGAGAMMRVAEEFTRGTQAFAAVHALSNNENAFRLHNNLMQNDALYKTHVEQSLTKSPDLTYMSKWLVDKAMGRYGREGRSQLQNTAAAVTCMPFATYPTQMLLNTAELISGQYGRAGLYGGLFSFVMTGVIGGALAVPGGMFVKELVELTLKAILGEDKDLEEELKSYAKNHKVPTKLIDFVTNGVFAEVFGVHLTPRLAVDVPVLTELLKAGQGEIPFGFNDLLGVYGSFSENIGRALEMAAQGATPMEIAMAGIPSTALQNILKAVANKKGATYRGEVSLSKQQGEEPTNIIKRTIGFKPLEQAEAEKRIDASKRLDTQYQVLFDRYKQPIIKNLVKAYTSDTQKDAEEYRSKALEIVREYAQVLKEKGQVDIQSKIKDVLTKARTEALMRMQGPDGALVKKQMSKFRRIHQEDIYKGD